MSIWLGRTIDFIWLDLIVIGNIIWIMFGMGIKLWFSYMVQHNCKIFNILVIPFRAVGREGPLKLSSLFCQFLKVLQKILEWCTGALTPPNLPALDIVQLKLCSISVSRNFKRRATKEYEVETLPHKVESTSILYWYLLPFFFTLRRSQRKYKICKQRNDNSSVTRINSNFVICFMLGLPQTLKEWERRRRKKYEIMVPMNKAREPVASERDSALRARSTRST